jgi:hypothetical protein
MLKCKKFFLAGNRILKEKFLKNTLPLKSTTAKNVHILGSKNNREILTLCIKKLFL